MLCGRSSLGVWQYVVIRTLMAVLACIFENYHMSARARTRERERE